MIEAITKNGQVLNIEGVWVAKYRDRQSVLSADLGEQLHMFNTIKLQDDKLVIEDTPNAIGRYDADEWEGLTIRSCDLQEGICQIERIPLDKENYKKVFKTLSR